MQREKDVQIAKGIGITLVVVGHILARGHSEGNEWFSTIHRLIYMFHMPFFVFLSGYVFFKPGRVERIISTYEEFSRFSKYQAFRLLLPFLALGIFITLGKYFLAPYVHVDNAPEILASDMLNLVWDTDSSPSKFLWYIFVLFTYGLFVPPLLRLLNFNIWLLLLVSIVIHLLPPTPHLYGHLISYFLLFFVVGGIARHYRARYRASIERHRYFFFVLFAASFAVSLMPIGHLQVKTIVGLCSIPALHNIAIILERQGDTIFRTLGDYTYIIYLLNTLCIGVAKAAIFQFTDWNHEKFFLVAPILIASGLVLPIVLRTHLLARVPYVDRMTA